MKILGLNVSFSDTNDEATESYALNEPASPIPIELVSYGRPIQHPSPGLVINGERNINVSLRRVAKLLTTS